MGFGEVGTQKRIEAKEVVDGKWERERESDVAG